jgi:hypothetical membrane protein
VSARHRFYALCGALAPVVFAMIVAIEGSLVHNYSHLSQPISDLGAYSLYGTYAYLQNLNFWAFGILVIVFGLGSRSTLPWSRGSTTTIVLFGSMVFLAGVFQDQPNPWPGSVHGLVSIFAFLLIIACQFLVWRRLRRLDVHERSAWSRYRWYSLASGVLSIVVLVVYSSISSSQPAFAGLGQRVFLAVPWLWIELTALKLLRLSRVGSGPSAT